MTEPDTPVSPTLGEYLAQMRQDATDLKGDLHSAEQARRRSNAIGLSLLAALILIVLAVLVVAAQNNRIAAQTADTNQRMSDCTTPGGKCYNQGAQRTGSAIASILRAQIALGECSRLYPGESGPAFDAKLRECVYQRILTDPGPTPAPVPTPSKAG
jgi:hypothetical protein